MMKTLPDSYQMFWAVIFSLPMIQTQPAVLWFAVSFAVWFCVAWFANWCDAKVPAK